MEPSEIYSINVTPDPLLAGGTGDIEITGPANTTIKVTITGNNGEEQCVEITTDAGGKGTHQWPVPTNWTSAEFVMPDGVTKETLPIIQPVG